MAQTETSSITVDPLIFLFKRPMLYNMRFFSATIILICYGVSGISLVQPNSILTTFTFTHAHATHDEHEHSHEPAPADQSEDHQSGDGTHTHCISVCGAFAHLSKSTSVNLSPALVAQSLKNPRRDVTIPDFPFVSSIFRPPIV